MQKNTLIVVEQAVDKCLDLDLTKFNQIEIIVSASQKTMPVEFVKELLRIQYQSGSPIELLTTKGSGGHHVEMYLAWLLGRHIEKNPESNITVIASDIDADALLDTCIDEEYHDRICIIQDGSLPAAAKDEMKLEKAPTKKAAAVDAPEEKVKQADNKLISKLMERKDILEARHQITGEPLPEPLHK